MKYFLHTLRAIRGIWTPARIKILAKGAADLAIFLIVLEILLRMMPSLIPLSLLGTFPPDLRTRIADRLHLSDNNTTQVFSSDDGRDITRPRPYAYIANTSGDGIEGVAMDSRGFCNPESSDMPLQKKVDILAIGDSLTWCLGVHPDETFTSELGRITHTHTYDLAGAGAGPYEEMEVLKHFGLELSPRVVLFDLYEGNDYRDAYKWQKRGEAMAAAKALASGSSTAALAPPKPKKKKIYPCRFPAAVCPLYKQYITNGIFGRIIYAAYQKIYKTSFLSDSSYAMNSIVASTKFIKDWVSPPRVAPRFSHVSFSFTGPDDSKFAFNQTDTDWDEADYADVARQSEHPFIEYDDALNTFAHLARKNHFIPVILYIPTAHTVYGPVTFTDPRVTDLLEWMSIGQREYLRMQSRGLGFTFLDPTEYLRSESASHRTPTTLLYFPGNIHLTSAGHHAIATYLAAHLTDDILKKLK